MKLWPSARADLPPQHVREAVNCFPEAMSQSRETPLRNPSLLPSVLPADSCSSGQEPTRAQRASPFSSHSEPEHTAAFHDTEHSHEQAADDTTIHGSVIPPFQPFFTLIQDSASQATIHPCVSYVFTDDEHDPIIDAVLSRVKYSAAGLSPQRPPARPPETSTKGRGDVEEGRVREGIQSIERFVVVTLGLDGRSVESTQSLTQDWHVDAAELSAAPTLDDGDGNVAIGVSPGSLNSQLRRGSGAPTERPKVEQSESMRDRMDGPLMLMIQGSEVAQRVSEEEGVQMGIDGLCELFQQRLQELRRVVEAGEREMAEAGKADQSVRNLKQEFAKYDQ